MVRLKTKQNRIYAISESVRNLKGGKRYSISSPFCIAAPKLLMRLFTILSKICVPKINIEVFKTEILQKIRGFLRTCMSTHGYFEPCYDSHNWANKIEAIRRLSDGDGK